MGAGAEVISVRSERERKCRWKAAATTALLQLSLIVVLGLRLPWAVVTNRPLIALR